MINTKIISLNPKSDRKPVNNISNPSYRGDFKSVLRQDVFCNAGLTKPIPFKGLTRELSNHLYNTRDQILDVVDKFMTTNKGMAGSMPQTWIQKIPHTNRNRSVKDVYAAFAKVVDLLKDQGSKTSEASEILSNSFSKAGIISKNDRLNLEFINYGSFGLAYLLEIPVNGKVERYVLKMAPDKRFNNKLSHGLDLEINRALFLSKNSGKKADRAPFYFADFSSGYMLVKCIDETLPKPKDVDLNRYCLSSNDDNSNTIYYHKIEYGGLVINTAAARTKTSRWAYKQVFDAPVEKKEQVWQNIYNDKTLPNRDEVELGLASSVKFLNDKPHYTDLLLNNNHSKLVKLGLMDKSFFENGYEYYDQIINDSDFEVRIKLAESIPSNHTNKFVNFVFNCLDYLKTIDIKQQAKDSLLPTAHDLIAVMLEKILFFTDEEKRTVFDQLFAFADDKTNVLLAKNLYNFENQDVRDDYFKKLAQNASIDVVNALIPNLTKIDSTLAKSYYKEFALNSNDETKALLVKASSIFSKQQQISWFKKLAVNSEKKTQLALIHSIKRLPEDYRYKFIKENLPDIRDLEPDVKFVLAHNVYAFPKEEGYRIYSDLAEDLSVLPPKLLNKLFSRLYDLKEDKPRQDQLFIRFAAIDNKALRTKMINDIDHAPEDLKIDFIRKCAQNLEGKDSFLVNSIIEKIQLLPSDEIVELYKEFYSFNEPKITETLIHQIDQLPDDAIGECFELFVQDFKSFNNQLQQSLMYLINESEAQYSIEESTKRAVKDIWSTCISI